MVWRARGDNKSWKITFKHTCWAFSWNLYNAYLLLSASVKSINLTFPECYIWPKSISFKKKRQKSLKLYCWEELYWVGQQILNFTFSLPSTGLLFFFNLKPRLKSVISTLPEQNMNNLFTLTYLFSYTQLFALEWRTKFETWL